MEEQIAQNATQRPQLPASPKKEQVPPVISINAPSAADDPGDVPSLTKPVTASDRQTVTAGSSPTATRSVKPFTTFGQSAHKWGSYIGVDLLWNYISGMGFSTWGEHTRIGRKFYSEPAKKVATFICKDLLKIGGASLEKSVGNTVSFVSIIIGGFLFTIPPLMVLENKHNRRSMWERLDKLRYGQDRVENDPRFKEAYDAMDEHLKKQGFWTGMASRIVSLAPLLVSVMVEGPREKTAPYYNAFEKGSERFYNALGLTEDRLFGFLPAAERSKAAKSFHRTSAIDAGCEPWYAVFHMITYRLFANLFGRDDKKVDKDTSVPVPPATLREMEQTVNMPNDQAKQPDDKHPAVKIKSVTLDAKLAAAPAAELAANV
jgi:hypothetical protein